MEENYIDSQFPNHDWPYFGVQAITNICRSAGVAATLVDLLICVVTDRLSLPIFTTDADFRRYAQLLPIRLHEPRKKQADSPSVS